ncbi:MAG: hypothetical protein IKS48_07995 [Eubacterium sp.]|nr:hypothetical protein [Eubacterium sp.]
MSQYLLAALCFVGYLTIYYLVGVAVSKILKLDNNPVRQLLVGMFAYGILFFIYVLPLKFMIVPVNVIGKIWVVILGLLCLFIVVTLRKYMAKGLKKWAAYIKKNKTAAIVVGLFTAFQVTFVEIYCRLVAGYNQVWFVGWVSNGVLHNELMTYDVVTGGPLSVFPNDRYLCTFLDHSAVICRIFHIHPMVEVRTVLTGIFVLVQCLVIWELAKCIGKGRQDRSILAFLLYWGVRNAMVGSQLLPSYYTFFRTYEGKGFVMNVPIPLMMLIMWKMYDKPEKTKYLWESVVIIWGSMTYSLSMMFTYPFVLAAYIPFMLAKKDGRKYMFRNIVVIGLECLVFFGIYYLGRIGILDLTIRR